MNATDVIDSYVHDVARRLPLGKRADVALEPRALLTDDLGFRADAEGRPPDGDLAVAMLDDFGRPADVAIRYYRPFTVIAPSDTWNFLVAAVAGGALVGLLASIGRGSAPPAALTQRAPGGRVPAGLLAYTGSFTTAWRMPWLVGLLAVAWLSAVVLAGCGILLYREFDRVRPAPAPA
jgi:hypothetical protein